MTIPKYFPCAYCHETVVNSILPPVCQACGTRYRYDARTGGYIPTASRPQVRDITSLILLCLGIFGLISERLPGGLAWFFAFAGFGLHYWNGLRTGVLSSRFGVFRWEWTVYRAESPLAFSIAKIIEGIWVLGLFIIFLFSL